MRTQTILRFMVVSIIFSAIIFLSGCENQSVDSVNVISPEVSAISDPQVRKEIKWLFDNNYITINQYAEWNSGKVNISTQPDGSQGYIFDNDTRITRKYIQSQLNKAPSNKNARMRIDSYLFAGGTMKVRIHSGVPSNWVTAVSQAISAWNALGYNVKFSYYNTTQDSDKSNELDIWYYNIGQDNAFASTDLPYSSYGSENISINSYFPIYNNGNEPTASSKKQIIAHELGHAVGFRHTDTLEGGMSAIPLACNVSKDQYSIMQPYWSWNSSYVGFTSCDKQNIDFYWG